MEKDRLRGLLLTKGEGKVNLLSTSSILFHIIDIINDLKSAPKVPCKGRNLINTIKGTASK